MKYRKRMTLKVFSLICSLFLLVLFNGQGLAEESTASDKEALFERLQLLSDEERVEAPDFSLPDMTGNTITLSELRGNVIFLNFWTTW